MDLKQRRITFLGSLVQGLLLVISLTVIYSSTACDAVSAQKKPNIVFVVADDMGWADIGYHNPEIKTPNLDKLAKEGVELDQHYVQPQCTPTRVSLITGRYPNRFGKHCTSASNQQAVPFGTVTLASVLKGLGYDTAISGKWHLGSKPEWGPLNYGFKHSYGSLAGAIGMYNHRYRLNRPEFTQTWHLDDQLIQDEEGHATDLCTKQAVHWIHTMQKPYFLYIPFHTVHTPLAEPQKYLDLNRHIENQDRRLMAAALSHLDESIGNIIEAIKETGQRENTLIVFFSDNGGIHTHYGGGQYPEPDPPLSQGFSSNFPLRGGKVTVYEGGIRVPAFVNWPGKLKPGKVSLPVHSNDWMPTICNLVGYTPSKDLLWDGKDIMPFLTGEKKKYSNPRTFYWHWGGDREKPGRIAVRKDDWKMVIPQNEKPAELYNLSTDPIEEKNLIQEHPEILFELKKLLEEEMKRDA